MIINKATSVFYNKYDVTFVLFIVLSFFLATNVQAKENKEKIVWQSYYDYVAIVPIDDPDYKGNDHPVELSPQDISNILGSIRLRDVDKGYIDIDVFNIFSGDDEDADYYSDNGGLTSSHRSLFNRTELNKISGPISKALATIQANEDVVFSVSGRHEGFIGKSQLSTTARLFYKNKQLNIIFGEVYVDIKQKYHRSGETSNVPSHADSYKLKHFRLKTGTREKRTKLPVEFVIDNSHILDTYKGKVRKDWLKVDIQILMTELNEAKKNKNGASKQITQEQEQLRRKVERLERLMQAREKAKATKQPMPNKPQKSLEERLSELKQLHDKGMISDDVYNEKAQKLLNEL